MSCAKAVIQAGGKGTRLAPYSTVLPKALMPIGEATVIDSLLAMMGRAGIGTVYVTVSKLGHLIRSYCGDGSRWGLRLRYVQEKKPLGTIGPLLPLRPELDDTFVVSNSDVTLDLDLSRFIEFHEANANVLTIAVSSQQVTIDYGVIDHRAGRVTGFREKPTQAFCVSTGVYCMAPEILDLIPSDRLFGLDELMDTLLAKGLRVGAYEHPGYWIDIGRVEDLRKAQELAETQWLKRSERQKVA